MKQLPLITAILLLPFMGLAQNNKPIADTMYIRIDMQLGHDFKIVHVARPKRKQLDEFYIYDPILKAYVAVADKMGLKYTPTKVEIEQ